jgi:hypothetical protein
VSITISAQDEFYLRGEMDVHIGLVRTIVQIGPS